MPEEDLIRLLAETEWRRRRIPVLEAAVFDQALEAGDLECKFMGAYGIYEQRLNRTFQNTLKTFQAARDARIKETALRFRIAAAIHNDQKKQGKHWHPADDGFVFSTLLLDQAIELFRKVCKANENDKIKIEPEELELVLAKDAN